MADTVQIHFLNTSALQLRAAEERSDMKGPGAKEERCVKRKDVRRGKEDCSGNT